ncbi:MAG: LysM peptidoglycan-binding domain-containing protein [Dehalococcoidia bacterium]|nr:LysM peptidoglycan-binding domain-containing protein [Dehalococcoidia bacterium]
MTDPNAQLQALLQPGSLANNLFPPASRYHGVPLATLQTTDGRTIVYLRRRFVPPPERFTLLQEHVVKQGDRLDNITAQYLGDPEQFWRVCDANGVIRPGELEVIGRRVRITLPEGLA